MARAVCLKGYVVFMGCGVGRESGIRDLDIKIPLVKQFQQNQFSGVGVLTPQKLVNGAEQGSGFVVVILFVVVVVLFREPFY